LMAGSTVRRRPRIPAAGVAGDAARCRVRSGENEPRRRVVERGAGPGRRRMTASAVGREAQRSVVRVRGGGVVRLMARVAVGRCTGVPLARVAGDAGRRCVSTGQSKARSRMIERRRLPPRRGMASRTGRREPRGSVARARSPGVVRLMARGTISRRPRVPAAGVASNAARCRVRSGKTEACRSMIEARPAPIGH
jgi:hypothetical protein